MSRLAPKGETIRRLFALSGNLCAFTDCKHKLVNDKGALITQVCHIEAAEEGGERYNKDQSDEERRGFENLMVMCLPHHVETDNVVKYTVPVLKEMKAAHEKRFLANTYNLPAGLEDVIVKEMQRKLDLIYGIVYENQSLIKEGNETGRETQEMLGNLTEMVKKLSSQSSIKIDQASIYAEQLDFIKQLRIENKAETALSAAIQFKKSKWGTLDDELKFKLIANIASILFDLGRQKEAAEYLLELKSVEYENGDTQAYIALAYAILHDHDNFDIAFTKAVSVNNKNVNLWVGYIYIQNPTTSIDKLMEKIPIDMLDKPEVLFTLGEALVNSGLESEGFEMMEKALQLTGSDPKANWQIKGIYAAKKLVSLITVEKIAYRKYTKNDIDAIESAIAIISEAWDFIKNTELSSNGWQILMNRGIAYKALGLLEKSEFDMQEAYRLSNKFIAFRNLLLHYLDLSKLEKAVDLIETTDSQNFDEDDKFELEIIKARLYTLQNKGDTAIEILSQRLDDKESDHNLRLLDLITLIYFESGAFEKALPYAAKMSKQYQKLPNGYIASAICHSRMGNIQMALDQLEIAFSFAENSNLPTFTILQIAEEYYSLKQYKKAIECFERLVDESRYDQAFKGLILSYFYANELEKCAEQCVKGLLLSPDDSTINEVLFRSYDELGEYLKAEEVLRQHFQSKAISSFDHFRLLGIQFFKKLGKPDQAVDLCLKISEPQNLSLIQRMGVARILLENGIIDIGLAMAYDALLDNYEESESHVIYLHTLVVRSKKPEESIVPETIQADTAFTIQDKNGKLSTYFLTDDKRLSG